MYMEFEVPVGGPKYRVIRDKELSVSYYLIIKDQKERGHYFTTS